MATKKAETKTTKEVAGEAKAISIELIKKLKELSRRSKRRFRQSSRRYAQKRSYQG